MYQAAKQGLQRSEQVLLIGADCPVMTVDDIEQAIQALNQTEAVITPSDDGGYVLLGLRKAHQNLFNNIQWGTETVLKTSLKRLEQIPHRILPSLWDVDHYEDLKRWKAML